MEKMGKSVDQIEVLERENGVMKFFGLGKA